jgi:hypothetical protein
MIFWVILDVAKLATVGLKKVVLHGKFAKAMCCSLDYMSFGF